MVIPIDASVKNVSIEIDGNEYPVAEKTTAVLKKLKEADERAAEREPWQMEMAMLEVLIGKTACKKIFNRGASENVDRIHAVYLGAVDAFTYNERVLAEKKMQQQSHEIRKKCEDMQPVIDLVASINGANKIKKPT